MRTIHVSAITDAVKKLCMDANYELEPDVLRAFDRALATERSPAGKQVLEILKANAELAKTKKIPYCQDTGFVVCFVELGQDVHVEGGLLTDAINAGIRAGYTEGYLRASIVRSPFDRVNTGDNTPGVIHAELVPGGTLRIQIMAKGGGCENRSKFKMLTPAEGVEGVKAWVLECIRTAGPDACPPLIAGVGVGGTFETRRGRPREGAARARQPPRHRPAGLWRRHHRARHPRADLSLPHHQPARRGDDRVPRAPAQGSGAVIQTAADGIKEVSPPLSDADVEALAAGDRVRITGTLYTARDAAHARLQPLVDAGRPLPIDVRGQIIYYTGPSPARPGHVVGSVGPTTGGRMDKFTPSLLALGLKGTIGKGARSQLVKDALARHKAVYFGAIGGAGAVLSGFVKKLEVVAYEDLGTEAIRRLEVEGFPVIVINDCRGGDLYQDGMKQYSREQS